MIGVILDLISVVDKGNHKRRAQISVWCLAKKVDMKNELYSISSKAKVKKIKLHANGFFSPPYIDDLISWYLRLQSILLCRLSLLSRKERTCWSMGVEESQSFVHLGYPMWALFGLSNLIMFLCLHNPLILRCILHFFGSFQDESVLIWFSGKEEKHLRLTHVSRIIPGQRTVSWCSLEA